jgi:hypothetical protein
MDPTDTLNLGQDATHAGQDYTAYFQIDGVEGQAGAQGPDDTAAGAHDLGNVTTAGRVQAVGTIGTDPFAANPAADVDMYHFHVSGPGLFAFSAEVFAGRIGSTLDPALSLFRVDPTDPAQPLKLVASNDNTRNATQASDGSLPLLNDALLFAGLPAGDYYLAVSGTLNVPGVGPGTDPGTNGIFDPNVSESGTNGFTTGDYVLNVLVQPALPSPQVVSTSPAGGQTLVAPPTRITVRFDGPVNLLTLADTAFGTTSDSALAGVFILGADGKKYYPRLESYDPTTNQATFLMLDALPNGVNELHLSGSLGLTGFGGNPLLGNDPNNPSADYVARFTVVSAPRGTGGNPLLWTGQEPNDSPDAPQDLGVLFPSELVAGVTIQGSLTPDALGNADVDYFRIQVLQNQLYNFDLTGPSDPLTGPTPAPEGLQMVVTDASGTPIVPLSQVGQNSLTAVLEPGTYYIRITGQLSGTVRYEVHVSVGGDTENPPPLSLGAPPVLRIRLADTTPPPVTPPTQTPFTGTPSPPQVTLSLGGDPRGAGDPPAVVVSLVNLTLAPAAGDLAEKSIASVLGPAPLFANIPLDATLALRAAPVGGVTINGGQGSPSAGGPGATLFAGTPAPLSVTLGNANAPGPFGGNSFDPMELRIAFSALYGVWQRLVDTLFSGTGRPTPSAPGQEEGDPSEKVAEVVGPWAAPGEEALAAGTPVELTDASGTARLPDDLVTPPERNAGGRTCRVGWAWAGTLLVGGLFGMIRAEGQPASGELPEGDRSQRRFPNRRG